jgi:hypothetical protein
VFLLLSDGITRMNYVYRTSDTVGISSKTTRRTSDRITKVTSHVFERFGVRVNDGITQIMDAYRTIDKVHTSSVRIHRTSYLTANIKDDVSAPYANVRHTRRTIDQTVDVEGRISIAYVYFTRKDRLRGAKSRHT